jgi:hypothetical protein
MTSDKVVTRVPIERNGMATIFRNIHKPFEGCTKKLMMINKNRLHHIVILSLFCSLHLSCFMSTECRDFFEMPREQQEARFRNYSLEQQVDIYMCGMDMEPPTIEFAGEIADRGQSASPYLLQRLKTERSESGQEKIIYIFRWMADRGKLQNKQEVIEQLKRVNSTMKDDFYKIRSQQYISQIEQSNK